MKVQRLVDWDLKQETGSSCWLVVKIDVHGFSHFLAPGGYFVVSIVDFVRGYSEKLVFEC